MCVSLKYWSAKQCDWLSHARPAPFPFPLFLFPGIVLESGCSTHSTAVCRSGAPQYSPPHDGTSEESSSEWKTQLETGPVISQLGGRSLRAVVEDGTDGPAGGPVDVRG